MKKLLSLAVLTGLFIIGLTYFNWWFNITPLIPILPEIAKIAIFLL